MHKVLIVDDEQLERQALSFILSNSNLAIGMIEEAVNGRQAISKAVKIVPDIIIMDIKMPGINGLEAAKQIKLELPEVKIIFLTAYSSFEYAQEAIKIGVEDFVIKPVNRDDIIEVLERTINKIENERSLRYKYKATELKLQQVTEFFTNEILSSMIAGDIEETRISEYIEHLNIRFVMGVCAVISLKGGAEQRSGQISRISQIIKTVVEKHGLKFILNHQKKYLNLLVVFEETLGQEKAERVVKEIFSELQKSISKQTGMAVVIGVSKMFTQIEKAANAFLQARIAGNNAKGSILFYSSYLDVENKTFKYPLNKEKQLFEKLLKGDLEGTLAVFGEIWDWILQNSGSNEEVKEKTYQFMVIVNRWMIEEFNVDRDILPNLNNNWKLMQSENDLKQFFKNFLIELLGNIKNRVKAPAAVLIEEVCSYIERNYMKEITLDDIAAMVGFSRYYFSKIFKHYKSMNFIDYLTLIRIKKSKELLKDARLSIKDISYTIGYSDPNYYTSVFKRIEGISPTEYRIKCTG